MAQPVKRRTLSLGSSHDLPVREFEPHVGLCADSMEPAWDSLSPSLGPSATHARSCALFVSQNKRKNLAIL